jgi:hypothetical protein
MDLVRSDIHFILKQVQLEFAGLTPVTPTPSGEGSKPVVHRTNSAPPIICLRARPARRSLERLTNRPAL